MRPLWALGAGSEETVPFRTLFGIQESTFSSVNLKAVLLFLRGLATRCRARSQGAGARFEAMDKSLQRLEKIGSGDGNRARKRGAEPRKFLVTLSGASRA